MEKLTADVNKIKARRIAAKADRLNGKTQNGRADGLHFLAGNTVPVRWHPGRSRDFDSYKQHKAAVLGQPGRASEEAMIRSLRYETQSKDAEIFRQALAGESWRGRGR